MEQDHCIIPSKKYRHMTEKERYKIEALLDSKKSHGEIAVLLGRDRSE